MSGTHFLGLCSMCGVAAWFNTAEARFAWESNHELHGEDE